MVALNHGIVGGSRGSPGQGTNGCRPGPGNPTGGAAAPSGAAALGALLRSLGERGWGSGGGLGDTEGRGRGVWGQSGDAGGGEGHGGMGVPERRVGGVGMGVPIKCPCSPHPSVRPCHPPLSLCLSPSCPRCGSTVPCPPGRLGRGTPARLSPRSWDPPAAPFWTMATPQRFGRRR
ncbi:glycine-rich cell wall structural protein 1-like [Onychostruthus taczanowskii]|uniref:glycine-rich cell wall structural protein 1-like n=1 Tax=Onychostruthus taczanowskii TaxID=356909 RepID=UPI001B800AD2|nr:glycine-rich cell wall structural protein 1-like [Onychostruthus taczanowskii]